MLCRSINATAATYARAGESVIVDHVLPRTAWSWIAEDWAGLPVLLVGVHCGAKDCCTGNKRVAIGQVAAASQLRTVHAGRVYNVEVDTTTASVDECAARLYAWLAARPEHIPGRT
ncbi:MAG: phosphotransferase-like protein [Catenulispora sp.]